MFVKVAGFCSPETEGVNLGMGEAEEVVEDHRAEGCAEIYEFLWGIVEFSTLVRWADDKYAHVVAGGGFDRGPVGLVNVVPMEVDVIELVGFDRVDNYVGRSMGREPDVAKFALGLEVVGDVENAARLEAGFEVAIEVDAVDAE